MPNLKEIRNRIASVSSTKQITSAMKMVSAAKLRKAQDAILQMRPYANKLHDVLVELCRNLEDAGEHPLIAKREVNRVMYVVLTSNRGLCGAFNANVIKRTLLEAKEKFPVQFEAGNVHLYCLGKKGYEFFISRKMKIAGVDNAIYDRLNWQRTVTIADHLMDLYRQREYDHIEIVYNHFRNAAVQVLSTEQFLPVPLAIDSSAKFSHKDYIFEPGKEELLSGLIPKTLRVQIYKSLLDSNASEHGARMTAMHKATDNATEMMRELKLTYNKARQASITKEILEIVSGANALKG